MPEATSKTQAMRALIELRERIFDGRLPGGTRLFEVPLAEDLEISRTPVREAMSRLAEEGLLERMRNGGFTVRSFGLTDVIDAIELRGVLEGTAARLAAERGAAPEALAQLNQTVELLDTCFGEVPEDVDIELYSDLNSRFHAQLAALCGSELIQREIARSSRLPFAAPSAFLPDRNAIADFRRSLSVAQLQHRTLVEAIRLREASRAESIAREHARLARRNLNFILEAGDGAARHTPELAFVQDPDH